MKRYIKASKYTDNLKREIDYLQSELRKLQEQYRVSEMVDPVIDDIMSQYTSITGFKPIIRKIYYRPDIDSALVSFGQVLCGGEVGLVNYTSPGRAKSTDPAMVHSDDSDAEIDQYVQRMVRSLVNNIKRDADYYLEKNETREDAILDMVTRRNGVYDEEQAKEFVDNVLDS